MEDKRKKRSPKVCVTQTLPSGSLRKMSAPPSKSATFSLGIPHPPSPKQKNKIKRVIKERLRPSAACEGVTPGPSLQHSFLTDVSHVCEMEGGLLSLLNDFHSGKLQAFGQVCSFEQLERVREMQEQLARLHFSLDICSEELREDTHAERNLEQLLNNLEELSNSIQKLNLAENQETPPSPSDDVTESLQ
ncbi:coiled-coil domain-containing protein 28B [Spea bombifrons]|uniref:coiled-coil domain-containing protein 28B n=1 Tax=Spea bombifrons TaxID=233779 RepID=UPI00234A13E0|nr:coiled-coil domain-containing protein 28B [Spea bombifrons]